MSATDLMPKPYARVEAHAIRLASYPQLAGRGGLSQDEMRFAATIPQHAERTAFRATRVLLREMLAEWLCCPPGDVPLTLDEDGNPLLQGTNVEVSAASPVGWCVIALSRGYPVGVHAEAFETGEHRSRTFLESWTRLEAAAKARAGIDDVVWGNWDATPGLVLSVAVHHRGPVQIDWHIESRLRRTSLHYPMHRSTPLPGSGPYALVNPETIKRRA